jgi:hypothetical protein
MFYATVLSVACKGSLNFSILLSLQEVSSMLLEKLTAAGIGDRPVVFVTHRSVSFSLLCQDCSFLSSSSH